MSERRNAMTRPDEANEQSGLRASLTEQRVSTDRSVGDEGILEQIWYEQNQMNKLMLLKLSRTKQMVEKDCTSLVTSSPVELRKQRDCLAVHSFVLHLLLSVKCWLAPKSQYAHKFLPHLLSSVYERAREVIPNIPLQSPSTTPLKAHFLPPCTQLYHHKHPNWNTAGSSLQ